MPNDLQLIRLQNPACSVVVAPALGGRILSYQALGREWLWRNPKLLDDRLQPREPLDSLPPPTSFDTWANWGGDKTWPAPQGWSGPDQWAGPPDAVLDAGRFHVTAQDVRRVELRSDVDPVTGLSIRRRIALDLSTNELTVASTLRNASSVTRRWAAWEVTQLATDWNAQPVGAVVVVETDNTTTPVVQLLEIEPLDYSHQAGQVHIPVQQRVGKLGFPGCSGRITLDAGSLGRFTQSFQVVEDAPYPDDGSRAELWMQYPTSEPLDRFPDLHPDAHLVELECLSPLTELASGSQVELVVHWSVES